jgi:hypothetical protein
MKIILLLLATVATQTWAENATRSWSVPTPDGLRLYAARKHVIKQLAKQLLHVQSQPWAKIALHNRIDDPCDSESLFLSVPDQERLAAQLTDAHWHVLRVGNDSRSTWFLSRDLHTVDSIRALLDDKAKLEAMQGAAPSPRGTKWVHALPVLRRGIVRTENAPGEDFREDPEPDDPRPDTVTDQNDDEADPEPEPERLDDVDQPYIRRHHMDRHDRPRENVPPTVRLYNYDGEYELLQRLQKAGFTMHPIATVIVERELRARVEREQAAKIPLAQPLY